MTYLDASVLMRNVLRQPDCLPLQPLGECVANEILEVECYRTLDRARHRAGLEPEAVADQRVAIALSLRPIGLIRTNRVLLQRASEPMFSPIATLDALHLTTALVYRDETGVAPLFATHDRTLAAAARAHGLEVVGA